MGAQPLEGFHGGAGIVQRRFRAEALGQHVLDAGELQHRADRATRDHTGTRGSRTDQDAGGAIAAIAEGGDRAVAGEGHLDQVLLAIGDALADGSDHITSLAHTDAHLAALVADDNDGPEAHFFTAFDGLGHAADLHHPFLPFGVTLLAPAVVTAAAAATAAVAAALAFTAAITAATAGRLTLGCCGHVGRRRNVAGLDLIVGFGHGESRDQN